MWNFNSLIIDYGLWCGFLLHKEHIFLSYDIFYGNKQIKNKIKTKELLRKRYEYWETDK